MQCRACGATLSGDPLAIMTHFTKDREHFRAYMAVVEETNAGTALVWKVVERLCEPTPTLDEPIPA